MTAIEAPLHALLAGGGTGGHVYPALAVARELARRSWRVSFAGRSGSLEERLAGREGIAFHALPARAVVGRGLAARLRALATLARSSLRARGLVRRVGARVVVGTGGYVSAPAVVGAWLAGRPSLLFEPNARAGSANRLLSRVAREAAVAYPESGVGLACPAVVTGVPVRREFFEAGEAHPRDVPRLLVLGGSQGAAPVNELMAAVLERLSGRFPRLEVLHQTGPDKLEAAREGYRRRALPPTVGVELVPYIEEMARALAGAHLVVSRAGAVTLAEICASGRPAVLLPLALAGGHQIDNARRMVEAGGALMLASEDLTEETLAAAVGDLLADPERRRSMGERLRGLARADAAGRIADRVEALAAVEARG